MKKTAFILGLFIIFSFFIGQANFVEAGKGIKARGSIPTLRMLEVEEPKILPTSPFYFLKEWGRGIRQFFAFNPVKKAELELKYADEKLVETAKVVDENCGESSGCNVRALGKAFNNYLSSQERLKKRLESLSEKNQNVSELISKTTEKVILHQALFDELLFLAKTRHDSATSPIIKRVGSSGDEFEQVIKNFDEKLKKRPVEVIEGIGKLRMNKAELIDAIAKGSIKTIEKLPYPQGIEELKALEVLTRIEEQLPEEAKKGIETAKEAIQKRLVENGEIQKAKDWKIEQGPSGWVSVEGAPLQIKVFEKVVEKIEEKAKEISPLKRGHIEPDIGPEGISEGIRELKTKIQAESRRPFDPIDSINFNFKLEIDGVIQAAFKEVSGIESETEIIEYQDGDDLVRGKYVTPNYPPERRGRTKYSNIVLKRGSVTGTKLHDWYERIVKGAKERKSVSVIVLDRAGQEVGRILLFDALPTKWKDAVPSAKGDTHMVEEIEFKAEGGIIIGKKITPDKAESGSKQIRVPAVCPLIAPDTSKGKEECLKAAKQLDEKYPGCNYAKICEEISEQKPSLDCGPSPGAPGTWKCIDGAWKDVGQCGKIQCLRYDPVCGTDGKTYSCGEIDAKSCGVEVAYRGECKKEEFPPPPISPEQPATSSEGVPAQKLPQPIFCTQEWNPVCGTDNKTYSNECTAKTAGVAVQYKGECHAEIGY